MKFFNNDIYSNSGDKTRTLYSPIVNDDGTISLVASGKEDIQSEIDSYREECDINVLLARYAAGDLDVFNKSVGSYGDFTNFPSTYAEALQIQINSKRYFDSLPVEIKEKFNNDANQFFVQTGSDEWFKVMSSMYPEEKGEENIVKKEIIDEVVK